MSTTFVGIDPAIRHNGFAMCLIKDDTVHFAKYKQFELWLYDALSWDKDAFIVVEDSSLQNITFSRYADNASKIKISRNVGMNQAVSKITIGWLTHLGHKVQGISPQDKGKKWSLDYAMSVMKGVNLSYTGKTKISQDEVDAFHLALIAKTIYKTVV